MRKLRIHRDYLMNPDPLSQTVLIVGLLGIVILLIMLVHSPKTNGPMNSIRGSWMIFAGKLIRGPFVNRYGWRLHNIL